MSMVSVANKQHDAVLMSSANSYLSMLIVCFSVCLYGVLFVFSPSELPALDLFVFNSLTVALLLFVYRYLCKQN